MTEQEAIERMKELGFNLTAGDWIRASDCALARLVGRALGVDDYRIAIWVPTSVEGEPI